MRKKEELRQVSAYLDTDGADIDPEIAADMLRMAQSSFWSLHYLIISLSLSVILIIEHKKIIPFYYSYCFL